MMVKKRGPYDRIDKVVKKKKQRQSSTEGTSNESFLQKDRNIMNDHILSLYKREAAKCGESSSMNLSASGDKGMSTNDDENEQTKNAVTSSKSSRKSMNLVEKRRNSGFSVKYPTTTTKDVAGLDDILKKLLLVCVRLENQEFLSAALSEKRAKRCKYILLNGNSGCGKTHLVHALAGETGLPLLEVAATEVVCGISGESEGRIRDFFEEALRISPCILFIDRIDAIAPKADLKDRGLERRMVTQLLASLDDFREKDNSFNVVVIAATSKMDSIDPELLNRFYYKYTVKNPSEEGRLMILKVLTKDLNIPSEDLEWLADHTPGFVGTDLSCLVEKGLEISIDRVIKKMVLEHSKVKNCESITNSPNQCDSEPSLEAVVSFYKARFQISSEEGKKRIFTLENFKEALKDTVPTSKNEGFFMVPKVTWDDVGALKGVKEALQQAFIWPVQYKQLYKNSYMESSKGILLYGPKGCGKTLLAKVLANECRINFLSVKGPELLNMYLGESEKAVRQCFERARNSAPCVIFFDEIDALCPSRSNSNTNAAADRVVNMLLTEMDGMEDRNEVFVIGATNRLGKIDSAVLRPGRLDRAIYVGLPTAEDRVDILKRLTKNKTKPKISDDVDLNLIGHDSRCEHFSGADLAHLIRTAFSHALKEHIASSIPGDMVEVKFSNFEHAFSVVKPSVTEKERKYFERISREKC